MCLGPGCKTPSQRPRRISTTGAPSRSSGRLTEGSKTSPRSVCVIRDLSTRIDRSVSGETINTSSIGSPTGCRNSMGSSGGTAVVGAEGSRNLNIDALALVDMGILEWSVGPVGVPAGVPVEEIEARASCGMLTPATSSWPEFSMALAGRLAKSSRSRRVPSSKRSAHPSFCLVTWNPKDDCFQVRLVR